VVGHETWVHVLCDEEMVGKKAGRGYDDKLKRVGAVAKRTSRVNCTNRIKCWRKEWEKEQGDRGNISLLCA
jgi:hypothetical protein